ncbi:MAG: hypothetical protein ABSE48_03170 [Verrucomicrobiota bacterium]|jgi:hypothetical protein
MKLHKALRQIFVPDKGVVRVEHRCLTRLDITSHQKGMDPLVRFGVCLQ